MVPERLRPELRPSGAAFSVRRSGILSTKYTETGTGSESDYIKGNAKAREDHIKNLPVGQMEILAWWTAGKVRRHFLPFARPACPAVRGRGSSGLSLYPKMHSYSWTREMGVNLRLQRAGEPGRSGVEENGGIVPRVRHRGSDDANSLSSSER